jgi:hypothetical protein
MRDTLLQLKDKNEKIYKRNINSCYSQLWIEQVEECEMMFSYFECKKGREGI